MVPEPAEVEAAIVRAAADPDAWQNVMEAIARALPGARPHLLGYDAALMRALPEAAAGYDLPHLDSYKAHYHGVNPYIPRWTRLPVGRVVYSEEVVPERDLVRGDYYNDWLRPQNDLRSGHVMVLAKAPGRMFMLGTHVERRTAERLEAPVLELMARIYPLLRHALAINRLTMGLRLDAEMLRDGIEPEGAAVLLLSRWGTILHANARAEAMLARGQAIRHDLRGHLGFADPRGALRLEVALGAGPRGGRAAFEVGPSLPRHEVRLLPIQPDTVARLGLPPPLRTPPPTMLAVLRPVAEARDEAAPLCATSASRVPRPRWPSLSPRACPWRRSLNDGVCRRTRCATRSRPPWPRLRRGGAVPSCVRSWSCADVGRAVAMQSRAAAWSFNRRRCNPLATPS